MTDHANLLIPAGILMLMALLFESINCQLAKAWRLHRIRARRNCTIAHTWGRRHGPVSDQFINPDYHWAWKCQRCGKTRTERMTRAEYEAHQHISRIESTPETLEE